MKQHYPTAPSVLELAATLGRPVSAIWSRAEALGLLRRGQSGSKRRPCPWTEEQLAYLARAWGKETLATITATLKTYYRTAKKRAASLGLDPTVYDSGRTRVDSEENPTGQRMPRPTDAPPGTEAKIQVLMERVERGEVLFHPRDRKADVR